MKNFRCLVLLLLLFLVSEDAVSQCLAVPNVMRARGSCFGTAVTNTSTHGHGARFANTTGTYAFSGAGAMIATDTLRICNNSTVTLANAIVGVFIVEAGSTMIISNTTFGNSAYVVNYGTVKFDQNVSMSRASATVAATMINATFSSVIDAQGFDLNVAGFLVNHGYIKNIDDFALTNALGNVCMGPQSVLSAAVINNASSDNAFTSSGTGSGCVQFSEEARAKCFTTDGTAASDNALLFCQGPSATTNFSSGGHGGCGTAGTGYGRGVPTTNCTKCNSPLPITLKSFNVTPSGEGVSLKWTTSAQWSSDYFIIEKSANGKDWVQVGIVQSDEDAKGLKHYSMTDYNPSSGLSYYKLSEVDIKGNRQDYAIEILEMEIRFSGFSIHPNPTTGNLNVKINGEPNIYQFEVFDITGKSIAKRKLNAGSNYLEDIFTSFGVYIAKLKVGPDYYTQKIVVQ